MMNDLRAFALRSVATKGSSLVIAVVVVSSSPDLAIASSASALLGAKDARRLDGFLGLKVFDPGCRRRTTGDGSVRHQPSVWSLSDHLDCGEQGVSREWSSPSELPVCCSSSSSCPILRGVRRAFFIFL